MHSELKLKLIFKMNEGMFIQIWKQRIFLHGRYVLNIISHLAVILTVFSLISVLHFEFPFFLLKYNLFLR